MQRLRKKMKGKAQIASWVRGVFMMMTLGHMTSILAKEEPAFEVVLTEAGRVRGRTEHQVSQWLGIPYANPPLGDLRWRPPVARTPWEGVLDATQFGDHCLQQDDAAAASASENCLFLNVYTPAAATGSPPRPVMVWIHGGANAFGASNDYDPRPLVETGDVVVVTLNYRLNVFGFLALPALDSEGHPATNYGIMDQQFALRWVRDNIKQFGGDPRNVTLFGQSSGGLNVITHLISSLSRGLFTRAVVQSGTYQLDTPSLQDSETSGTAFAEKMGCKIDTPACMRAISGTDLLAAAGNYQGNAYNQSTVDGSILPVAQRSALTAGNIAKVPVMIGSNSDEGLFQVDDRLTPSDYRSWVQGYASAFHKPPQRVFSLYPLRLFRSPADAASAIAGDSVFACTARTFSMLLSGRVPTYRYEFSDFPAGTAGADHGAELKYFFNRQREIANPSQRALKYFSRTNGRPDSLQPASRTLSETMRLTWAVFAATGDPRSPKIPSWPKATVGLIGLRTPIPRVVSDADFSRSHNCSFWN